MSAPTLEREKDGALVLGNLAPWFVSVLLEMPELLRPEQPDPVKQRLYPEPSDDSQQRDEWKRYVHPDLFALLASARDVVARDLESLTPSDDESPLGAWELHIPGTHVNAWLSGLNAARLTLAAEHAIEEEDMGDEQLADDNEWDDRRIAVAKIHMLGWMQQMILEDQHPPPEGMQVPDALPPDF